MEVGAVIIRCDKTHPLEDCLSAGPICALPAELLVVLERCREGETKIFFFHVQQRLFFGPFVASGAAALDVVPSLWQGECRAQMRVKALRGQSQQQLPESAVGHILDYSSTVRVWTPMRISLHCRAQSSRKAGVQGPRSMEAMGQAECSGDVRHSDRITSTRRDTHRTDSASSSAPSRVVHSSRLSLSTADQQWSSTEATRCQNHRGEPPPAAGALRDATTAAASRRSWRWFSAELVRCGAGAGH